MSSVGVEMIAAERLRQVEEGYTQEHDDRHGDQSLAWAAVCYAAPDYVLVRPPGARFTPRNLPALGDPFPWLSRDDKRMMRPVNPNDLMGGMSDEGYPLTGDYGKEGMSEADVRKLRLRELVKAGALIAAEIDRITRADVAS